jgi:hypothetical protein
MVIELVTPKSRPALDESVKSVREAARKLESEDDLKEPDGAKPVPEDTFGLPPVEKIEHESPPKDPNAPSLSLSADEEEAVSVDLTPAPRPS